MIIPFSLGSKSLTGHRLVGDRLMRFAFVDEAGISANEPVAVVAGLIVHADHKWKLLEEYRNELVRKFIPPADQTGFVFHATELFSGGKYFKRDQWPLQVRLAILKALLAAIPKYELSLVVGSMPREERFVITCGKREAPFRHTTAYALCVAGIESYMRSFAEPNEVTLIVAENTTDTRRMIRQVHHDLLVQHEGLTKIAAFQEIMPIRHIVDTVHFTENEYSALLQFADACAFTVRRYVAGLDHADELMRILTDGAFATHDMKESKEAGYTVFVQGASLEQVRRHNDTAAALGLPPGQWLVYSRSNVAAEDKGRA